MSVPTRAVTTAAVAALLAVAASLGRWPLVLLAAGLVLVVAIGWPRLAAAPARTGTGVVVGLGGLAGVVAVALTEGEPLLRALPEVLALSVLVAFIHELVRRDGRERLVESVAGTASGILVAATVAGWIAAARTDGGVPLVVTGATALAVAAAVSGVRVGAWLGAAVTVVAAAGAGAGVAAVLPVVDPVPGGLVGLAVGLLAAATHRLLDRLPSIGDRWAAIAGSVLPVTVTGVVVYVVGRVLVG